jgi:Rieske 2Fe-2S family protein
MDGTSGFDRTQYPLHRVASDTWDGHLFVSLGADPGPLAEQLCTLPGKFRPWRMQDLRRRWQCRYDVRANWKLIIQNYSECLHCPVIHPVLNRLSHYMSGENEPLQPTYLGGRMDLREGVETMSMDGRCRRPWLPDLPPTERRHVYYYAILPNFLLTLAPDYMMTHTLWPLAHDRTVVVCELHFQPDDPADHRDVVDFWDMTNRQDWHVSELAQLGISSRAYRPGPYSNREDLLHAFDRFIVSVHQG